jgi:hypothetical protein
MSEGEKNFTIGDFGWMEIRMGGIILHKFQDEENEIDVYNVTFLLNIEDETEDGHFVHVETLITNPDKLAACHMGAQILTAFVGDDAVIATVNVFDENGDEVEEFNLNDETVASMMKPDRVLH